MCFQLTISFFSVLRTIEPIHSGCSLRLLFTCGSLSKPFPLSHKFHSFGEPSLKQKEHMRTLSQSPAQFLSPKDQRVRYNYGESEKKDIMTEGVGGPTLTKVVDDEKMEFSLFQPLREPWSSLSSRSPSTDELVWTTYNWARGHRRGGHAGRRRDRRAYRALVKSLPPTRRTFADADVRIYAEIWRELSTPFSPQAGTPVRADYSRKVALKIRLNGAN